MDPTALAIGAVGLALQLHEAVIGCLEALRNFRDAGEHNALLNCKLQIEQYLLAKWAQRCELSQGRLNRHLPHVDDQIMVLMVLRNMLGLVSEAETLKKKYGMNYVSAAGYDVSAASQRMFGALLKFPRKEPAASNLAQLAVPPLSRSTSGREAGLATTTEDLAAFVKLVEKGKTAMGFLNKYRWVVVDSRRFEDLIRHLQDLNKSLYRLSQRSVPAEVLEGDILDATSDRYIDIVERATEDLYPTASAAMNIRRTIAHLESTGAPSSSLSAIGPYRNLRIEPEQLHFRSKSPPTAQARALATYRPRHGHSRTVLVESRKFQCSLSDDTRDATVKQAENLARILQKKPSRAAADYFRLLECAGFYATDEQVGYVFDLPAGVNPSQAPKSLDELLYSEGNRVSPPLEQRLSLCKALCNSIYWLHASNLVHKGIRSSNIIFFEPEDDPSSSFPRYDAPYIVGFNHSRPDGPNNPTITIAAASEDEARYRHPAASASVSNRSTKIHDMYSLGLVLLEIAHWEKLKDLVEDRAGEAVPRYLLGGESPVRVMDYLVGSRLQRIVHRCIRCDFDVDLDDTEAASVLRGIFLHEIASEIMKCSV